MPCRTVLRHGRRYVANRSRGQREEPVGKGSLMNTHARAFVRMLVVVGILVLGISLVSAGEIVIANEQVPAGAVSKAVLEQIFLGGAKAFGNGEAIVVVTLKEGPVHESFLKSYLSKTPPQFQRAWRDLVFGGGASKLPQAFATEAELVAYVAKTRGAIGYIDEGTPHDGVKVLKVN